jgi:uncharacterized membrane protein
MSLPGFSAEASLYTANEYYHSAEDFTPLSGDVHLAQVEFPKDIEFTRVRCFPNFQQVCKRICTPDFCFPICEYKFLGYVCY